MFYLYKIIHEKIKRYSLVKMKVIERDRIVDESAINLKVWRTWAKFQPKDSELREIQKMVPINFPSHFGLGKKTPKTEQ